MQAMSPNRFRYLVALLFLWTVDIAVCPASQIAGPVWDCHVIDDSSRGADGVRLADVNGDGRLDIVTGWEEGGVLRVYLQPAPGTSKDRWPAVTVGRTPAIEDAVFADLDGDGAVDVISSCEGKARMMFVHWAPKDGDPYLNKDAWRQEAIPESVDRMMWMFAVPAQLDGRKGLDIIAGGKGDSELGWFEAPDDARTLDGYRWHAISPLGWVMSIILDDMDGDGDLDILITDRKGPLRGCRWLENPDPGKSKSQPWTNHFIGARDREVMFATVADLDRDGKSDILVSAKRAEVLWFKRIDPNGRSWRRITIPYPDNTGTAKGIAVGDIDGDTRKDIVVSCEHAEPPKSGVIWMRCEGDLLTAPWQGYQISGSRGIKFDRLELLDLDGDGDLDVLTCEERHAGRGIGVFWYENPR